VHVGDRWYRGRILLVSKGDSVLAVNYVDLEHYLTSVVGSEMHANAPSEALKAQAIAARSYALVHMIRPASDWFDLGDNQRWQVYKGLNSEYNTGFKAVGDTAGQVLSYKGGVVESLYASTDAIVASAHKGRGMSQLGAYDLAKQGYNYQQILSRYYPGVALARVILQQ
ncbi:MAG: SpoIID/LytB domain-containing protein, partial [Microcystaceae cyanobacterium]